MENQPDSPGKPLIGLSACISGFPVRYDATHRQAIFLEVVAANADWVSFCPEASAGMGTPRPPMDLQQLDDGRVIARSSADAERDIDTPIRRVSQAFLGAYPNLHGYVHQSRSPSCGRGSSKIYADGALVHADYDGLFTQELKACYPDLPALEADELDNPLALLDFLQRVRCYQSRGSGKGDDTEAVSRRLMALRPDSARPEMLFERIINLIRQADLALPQSTTDTEAFMAALLNALRGD